MKSRYDPDGAFAFARSVPG
ncbi:hypothetical protein LZG04_20715 [Saccharothrix sp. S26]|nr:hypothetical protein [Saccharothrix sp. S26]